MSVTTRRMQDLTVHDHTLTVPLDWGNADDARTIDVHASVVVAGGGEDRPYLLYLQGGPGFEAPRPFHAPASPAWLDAALRHFRVVLLDQRGTGRSTPVGDADLGGGTDAVVEYLTHFRAPSIVRDAEALRAELGAQTWSVLGQSFGGFTTLSYLTTDADALAHVFFTGGLSSVGRHPDDAYAATYAKMAAASERYWRRFTGHRDAFRRLADLAGEGRLVLPDGEVVSVSRLRSLGMLLGSNDGWQTLWALLELEPTSTALRHDLAAALPFGARNPIYAVLHESCWADGAVTGWSAQRTLPDAFAHDVTLLTGEHVRSEWFDTVPGLRPWGAVARRLADHAWPRLYDEDALRASAATGAAAVYVNDVYVPYEASALTLELLPGVIPWVTSEHEHSGLRSGDVLDHLIDLAHGRRVR